MSLGNAAGPRPPFWFGGIAIDDLTTREVLSRIRDALNERRQMLICTPNASYVVRCARDESFRDVLAACDLRVPDGMGVILASRILHRPLREMVGGRLLMTAVCAAASENRWRIVFFGGRAPIASRCADAARAHWPNIDASGVDVDAVDPRVPPAELANASGDILFISLGAPKQEQLMAWNRASLNFRVVIGVGGSFDYFGGRFTTPPRWATFAGVEWLFRIRNEPSRLLRRYVHDLPRFAWLVVTEASRRVVVRARMRAVPGPREDVER